MLELQQPTRNPRFSRQFGTFEAITHSALGYREIARTKASILKQYGLAAERSRRLGSEVEGLLSDYLQIQVRPPVLSSLGISDSAEQLLEAARANLKQFEGELAQCFAHDFVGRIVQHEGRAAHISWCEFGTSRGILNRKITVTRHEHELTKLRVYKLGTSAVELPRRAQKLVAAMPLLAPYCQIVAGTLNSKSESVIAEMTERTGLGKAIDWGRQTAGDVTRRIASAAAAIPLAASDPALLIGEFVLYGWE